MKGGCHLIAGRLLDGVSTEVRRRMRITVAAGVITEIAPAASLPAGEVVDLGHCTVMPALVDGCVFLSRSPSIADDAGKAGSPGRHAGYCHAHGVLGVAAADTDAPLAARLKDDGALVACMANAPASGPGGTPYTRIALTADIEAKDPFTPRLGATELAARIRAASGPVVVAANGPEAIAMAITAGGGAIEQGYGIDEEHLRAMAVTKILWFPSVVRAKNGLDGSAGGGSVCCRFSQRYVAPGKADPEAECRWRRLLDAQIGAIGRARQLGVRMAVATGAGSVGILHGEAVAEEIKLFIKAGMSLPAAIIGAASHGAAFFGMEQIGPLRPGRHATFIATRGTEHQAPRKLSYLEAVYIDGRPSPRYHHSS